MMNNHGHFKSSDKKQKVNLKSILKLFKYYKKYTFILLIILVATVAYALFQIITPVLVGDTTDIIISSVASTGSINFIDLYKALEVLLMVNIASSFFQLVSGSLMSLITQKTIFRLRNDLIDKINRIEISYYDKTKFGEILSRVTNDVETIATSLNSVINNIISSIVLLVGIVYIMTRIDFALTLIIIFMVPLSLISILLIVKKSQKYHREQQDNIGRVNAHVEEYYNAHDIVKIFNAEDLSENKFEEINKDLQKSMFKAQYFSGLMIPVSLFITNLGYALVVIVGAFKALNGNISVGNIQTLLIYTRKISEPVQIFSESINLLQSAAAASDRIFDFLETEEMTFEEPKNVITECQGSVEFKNVKFGYSPDNILMNDISFKVEPGEMCAIVGPTGAGKTTLINLIMRFYDVLDGEILVDGININDLSRENLRDSIGMVLQDTWLFNGSIKDNILYGDGAKSLEDVIESAKNANIHHYIKTLKDGYDSEINENASNISAGQKQLITIARAFLSNPKILILDEATSNVDTRTEQLIQKAMEKLTQGQTSFVIAHRLSTIKNADKIIVMDQGNIIEVGSHDELIEQGGFYKTLYMSQFDEH